MKKAICYFTLMVLVFLSACKSSSVDPDPEPGTEAKTIEELVVPENFDFKTAGTVTLDITDNDNGAYYYIYAYEDVMTSQEITYIDDEGKEVTESVQLANNLNTVELAIVRVFSGKAKLSLNVPTNVKRFLLKKRYKNAFVTAFTSDISTERPTTISFNGNTLKTKSLNSGFSLKAGLANDILWCVNGSGELFTVNPEDMTTVQKPDLAEGTWTIAMDFQNHQFYTIGRSSPYKLYRYDVDVENNYSVSVPTIVNNDLGFGGPRLEYANDEGFLYFSNKDFS